MNEGYTIMNILSIEQAKQFARKNPVVIVTGVTGQDGSFMVDYLLKNTELEIFGGARRLSVSNHENLDHLIKEPRFHLINFDLTDAHSVLNIVCELKPSYFINFAAQSFVKSSWDFPAQTWETNTTSIIHILEAIRTHCPTCRFYNAGSSEEFGDVSYSPQDENHPLRPRSPYGASKAAARQIVKVYRESYKLYAVQGWLFNHEGTRRGEEFVTRKISKGVARIFTDLKNGVSVSPMELGNLDAKRDWSDAEDCVDAVWRMLNQDLYDNNVKSRLSVFKSEWRDMPTPCPKSNIAEFLSSHVKEYVVSSGETHSIREFVELSFKCVGINGKWEGEGLNEVFYYDGDANWNERSLPLVKINSFYYRPAEVELLHGNSTTIKHFLGWNPKVNFKQLVEKMVNADLHRLQK